MSGTAVSEANAVPVIVGGNEWFQPAELPQNLTWIEWRDACPDNICVIDGEGWQWASLAEVRALFLETIPGYDGSDRYSCPGVGPGSGCVDAFFDVIDSGPFGTARVVFGWTRDLPFIDSTDETVAYVPFVTDSLTQSRMDEAGWGTAPAGSGFGPVWLFRAVPEPGTWMLLASGLVGLAVAQRISQGQERLHRAR